MCAQIQSGWLTAGRKNKEFQITLAQKWQKEYAITCNSGSSANLLAVSALVEAGFWKPGDEIITVATSFPTTINPLIQHGLVPVFTDVDIGTYNATHHAIGDALSKKTKGIMLAHTMGHPFPLAIAEMAQALKLPLIEDCCDAFGAGWSDGSLVGSRGALATCSFFPAHHIMCGEGGVVFTDDHDLKKIVDSVGSWGRDCWCDPGEENCCGKRFDWSWPNMPHGFDHKYTFSTLGYNLKMTDVQAVCGLEQLKKVHTFIEMRNENWLYLRASMEDLADHIILPTRQSWANPSWFGFVMTIREPGQRTALQEYLASKKVGSRLLFGGNITRQPYMKNKTFRISGSLENSDKVMDDTLWIGCWPGLTTEMLDYTVDLLEGFFE